MNKWPLIRCLRLGLAVLGFGCGTGSGDPQGFQENLAATAQVAEKGKAQVKPAPRLTKPVKIEFQTD